MKQRNTSNASDIQVKISVAEGQSVAGAGSPGKPVAQSCSQRTMDCLSCGKLDNRSGRYKQIEFWKTVSFSVVMLAIVLIVIIIVTGSAIALSGDDFDFQSALVNNWWSGVEFLLLLITALGPVYLSNREELNRLNSQGDFENRVLVTLTGLSKSNTLMMRSLADRSFENFFPDDYIQERIRVARDQTIKLKNPDHPFVRLNTTYQDWKRLRDHIKNLLSSMHSGGFIANDCGVPTVEMQYCWALTYERSSLRDHLNNKFRVIIVREDLLRRVGTKSYDEVMTEEAIYDNEQKKYFKNRWKLLQRMAVILQDTKARLSAMEETRTNGGAPRQDAVPDDLLLVENVTFAVPETASASQPSWLEWPTTW